MNSRISSLIVLGATLIGIAASALAQNAPESAVQSIVKKNTIGEWGAGIIIGRPLQHTRESGWNWKTMEMSIGEGNFPGDSRYLGSSYKISTNDERVFDQFAALDDKKVYVFRYKEKSGWDPEIEDSHTQIIGIEEMKDDFAASKLPMSMTITRGRPAGSSKGKILPGRIIDVMRWGRGDHNICTMVIELGGIRASASTDTATDKINIYSEEGCQYAENLLPYGVEVEVTYDEDAWEVYDKNDGIARKIKVVDTRNAALSNVSESITTKSGMSAPTLNSPNKIDSLTYRQIKEMLLRDTSFTNEVIRRTPVRR